MSRLKSETFMKVTAGTYPTTPDQRLMPEAGFAYRFIKSEAAPAGYTCESCKEKPASEIYVVTSGTLLDNCSAAVNLDARVPRGNLSSALCGACKYQRITYADGTVTVPQDHRIVIALTWPRG